MDDMSFNTAAAEDKGRERMSKPKNRPAEGLCKYNLLHRWCPCPLHVLVTCWYHNKRMCLAVPSIAKAYDSFSTWVVSPMPSEMMGRQSGFASRYALRRLAMPGNK